MTCFAGARRTDADANVGDQRRSFLATVRGSPVPPVSSDSVRSRLAAVSSAAHSQVIRGLVEIDNSVMVSTLSASSTLVTQRMNTRLRVDVTQGASYRIGLGDPARVGAGHYRDRVTYRSVSDDGLQRVLLSHLDAVQLSVRGQAALVGADVTDPGTLDWSAMAMLSVWPDEEEPGQAWHSDPGVALSVTDVGDGSRELIVLAASGLLVDLERVENGDYEHFVPLFGRHRSFGVLELDGELRRSWSRAASRW